MTMTPTTIFILATAVPALVLAVGECVKLVLSAKTRALEARTRQSERFRTHVRRLSADGAVVPAGVMQFLKQASDTMDTKWLCLAVVGFAPSDRDTEKLDSDQEDAVRDFKSGFRTLSHEQRRELAAAVNAAGLASSYTRPATGPIVRWALRFSEANCAPNKAVGPQVVRRFEREAVRHNFFDADFLRGRSGVVPTSIDTETL